MRRGPVNRKEPDSSRSVKVGCPYCGEAFYQTRDDGWMEPSPRACSPEHARRMGQWNRWVRESSDAIRLAHRAAALPPAGPSMLALVKEFAA